VAVTPVWDAEHHELSLDSVVVKRFRTPAPIQERILATFEEDGWPERIDDPLPHVQGQDSKRRLHNAINCLNRSHLTRAIHFYGDGTGTGILWRRL
jgi:hypothetical protein